MRVCVIGTGYVGLVTGTALAEMGNDVVCIDNNQEKVNQLQDGTIPIYEPGLNELIRSNVSESRLSFSTDIKKAVEESLICIIAVGTPQKEDGSCDLSYVFEVAELIGKHMNGYKIIMTKSTVPIGTSAKVKEIVSSLTNEEFDVVSNPEFLKQGNAVEDFLNPDRVVIGSDSQKATDIVRELYAPFMKTGNLIITMDIRSAEMTKYAANAFLATKISFINEIANICEKIGVDVESIRVGMSTDKRIGPQFLYPGIGYGGSCFPKDVNALASIAAENGMEANILSCVDKINKDQRYKFVDKIINHFGDIKGKQIAIWGLAFKPKTNDMREAPAIIIINELLKKGAKVIAYDPKAIELAQTIFEGDIEYKHNRYEVLPNSDALLLLTEWNEFRRPDFDKMKELMKEPTIFDGRNQYDKERMLNRGFKYYSIGR